MKFCIIIILFFVLLSCCNNIEEKEKATKEDISTRFGRLNVSGTLLSLVKKGVLEEKIKGSKKYYFIKYETRKII